MTSSVVNNSDPDIEKLIKVASILKNDLENLKSKPIVPSCPINHLDIILDDVAKGRFDEEKYKTWRSVHWHISNPGKSGGGVSKNVSTIERPPPTMESNDLNNIHHKYVHYPKIIIPNLQHKYMFEKIPSSLKSPVSYKHRKEIRTLKCISSKSRQRSICSDRNTLRKERNPPINIPPLTSDNYYMNIWPSLNQNRVNSVYDDSTSELRSRLSYHPLILTQSKVQKQVSLTKHQLPITDLPPSNVVKNPRLNKGYFIYSHETDSDDSLQYPNNELLSRPKLENRENDFDSHADHEIRDQFTSRSGLDIERTSEIGAPQIDFERFVHRLENQLTEAFKSLSFKKPSHEVSQNNEDHSQINGDPECNLGGHKELKQVKADDVEIPNRIYDVNLEQSPVQSNIQTPRGDVIHSPVSNDKDFVNYIDACTNTSFDLNEHDVGDVENLNKCNINSEVAQQETSSRIDETSNAPQQPVDSDSPRHVKFSDSTSVSMQLSERQETPKENQYSENEAEVSHTDLESSLSNLVESVHESENNIEIEDEHANIDCQSFKTTQKQHQNIESSDSSHVFNQSSHLSKTDQGNRDSSNQNTSDVSDIQPSERDDIYIPEFHESDEKIVSVENIYSESIQTSSSKYTLSDSTVLAVVEGSDTVSSGEIVVPSIEIGDVSISDGEIAFEASINDITPGDQIAIKVSTKDGLLQELISQSTSSYKSDEFVRERSKYTQTSDQDPNEFNQGSLIKDTCSCVSEGEVPEDDSEKPSTEDMKLLLQENEALRRRVASISGRFQFKYKKRCD